MNVLAIKEPTPRQANAETKTLRQTLADALRKRDAAKHARDEIAQALGRADEFIEGLRNAATHSEGVISHDVAARAEEIAAALKAGFTVPKLPEASDEAVRAHTILARSAVAITSAEAARTTLASDLSGAEAALILAQTNAHKIAAAVVASVADREALALIDLERRSAGLRRRLMGVSRMRAPSMPRFPIDAMTASVLRGDMTPNFAHETEVDVACWIDLERRLLNGEIDAEPTRAA